MNVVVHYWAYHDIDRANLADCARPGWGCWAYPSDRRAFEHWMETNCPLAECTPRFNSGDPMYTIHITNEEEATLFKLQWV